LAKSSTLATPPTIRIKREKWKNGLHSVARDESGHWITTRKWHSQKDTEAVKDYVVLKVSFPKEYKKKTTVTKATKSDFKRTGVRPNKYIYLMQSKYGNEFRRFSMTSEELFEMNETNKKYLFNRTRDEYAKGGSPIKLKILRIYNAIDGSVIKTYIGQKYEQ